MLVRAWRTELRGGAGADLLEAEAGSMPVQWREVAHAALELLRGWRSDVRDRAGEDRVLGVLVEGLDRADWDLRSSPDHPAGAPVARAVDRSAAGDPVAFAAGAGDLLDRIAREVPGGAYAVAALVAALDAQGLGEFDPQAQGADVKARVVRQLVLDVWERSLDGGPSVPLASTKAKR